CVIANGGIDSVPQAQEQLRHVDGVMVGRAAYHRPLFLAELVLAIERAGQLPSRADVLESYLPYCARELAAGERLSALTRHVLGLYAGAPGARAFRRVPHEGA